MAGRHGLIVLVCLLAAQTSVARTFEVAAWRGETVAARVPDFAELASAPEGIALKVGALRPVSYVPSPYAVQILSCYDRVAWGASDGPRVVEISVSADAKPGVYDCGALRVRVVDRVLPPASEWKYYLDLWQHPWAVSRYAGLKPFSDAHYRSMRPLWRMLAESGCKVLTTTILDRPWDHQCYDAYRSMIRHVRAKDGSWRFDYRLFDEYVAFGQSCGIGPDIACYTMCPWDYVVSWEDEAGGGHSVKAIPGSAEFKDYWGAFLVDFSVHLKEKGWFDHTYIAMDERAAEDVINIVKFVNEKAPGLKVSLAGNRSPEKFRGIRLDACCYSLPRLEHPEAAKDAAERLSKGLLTTYYVCCGPDCPNTFCSSAPGEAFWLGVYPAFSGLSGFLRWAWNCWPRDPMKDASFDGNPPDGWKAGDTFLVYPDGSPSRRFLELRNGIVAAEKLRILKTNGECQPEIEALVPLFNRTKAMKSDVDFVGLRTKVLELVNR